MGPTASNDVLIMYFDNQNNTLKWHSKIKKKELDTEGYVITRVGRGTRIKPEIQIEILKRINNFIMIINVTNGHYYSINNYYYVVMNIHRQKGN